MDESEYDTEFEPESDEFEYSDGGEFESTLDEATEMELAAELLEIVDEEELDQFIGNVLRSAGRAAGRALRTPTGRALGGLLKGAAKKALPHLGRAVGSYLGGRTGGDVAARVASHAGRLFGLELEGLSPEDQEYEVARRFVRFASDAAQRAAQSPSSSPQQTARDATIAAAVRHAPGFLSTSDAPQFSPKSRGEGRWIRRGDKIILIGA
jgi:hypothetical protein